MSRSPLLRCGSVVAACLIALGPVRADEGMWTFDNLPRQQLQAKYGFTPTQAWLDHLRAASVRLSAGGSGAFVSAHGLLLTNQHVVRGYLSQRTAVPGQNYLIDGFYAASPGAELKAPGLEATVLVSSENVTARVRAGETGDSAAQQASGRRAAIAAIVKESEETWGLRSDVVSLYQGGEYWLYRYQVYTDLRVVFAPEQDAANFGGDTDNFTFPRFKLDFALLRVYQNGQPLAGNEYLRWNPLGASAGDLIFIAGSPGATRRAQTVAQMEYQRDVYDPAYLHVLDSRIGAMQAYAARGPAQAMTSTTRLLALENVRKSSQGEMRALQSQTLMNSKRADEAAFRAKVQANPVWRAQWGGAWDSIAAAEAKAATRSQPIFYRGLDSDLATVAQNLVAYAAAAKPTDAVRNAILNAAPVDLDLERARIAAALQLDQEGAPDDPFVLAALGGKTPAAAAALIAGTKLQDKAYRQQLVDGGAAAINGSDDAMLVLARKLQPIRDEFSAWTAANVQSAIDRAAEELAQARFAVYGNTTYPDATQSLRLSYGQVLGYSAGGTEVPAKTNYYGLYARAAAFDFKPPFDLPQRYTAPMPAIDMATTLDFVTTADISGGSSGSPVVNRQGEVVGVEFDQNQESLAGAFAYDDVSARSIAVGTPAITQALGKLYGAQALLKEIETP